MAKKAKDNGAEMVPVKKEKPIKPVKGETYNLALPQDVVNFSILLKKFIQEQKLSVIISGKQYVLVDGWKFAGLNFGIVPIASEPKDLSKDLEIKYSCTCDLVNIVSDKKIGYGFALCSNKEKMKKHFEEYAVASMAQTRAISKALRNSIGFVMTAAGFESTPAEEAEGIKTSVSKDEEENPELAKAIMELQKQTDYKTFLIIVDAWKEFHHEPEFQRVSREMQKKLKT